MIDMHPSLRKFYPTHTIFPTATYFLCGQETDLTLQPTSLKPPWRLGSGIKMHLGILTAEQGTAILCGEDDRQNP